jgi:hypothetical protein
MERLRSACRFLLLIGLLLGGLPSVWGQDAPAAAEAPSTGPLLVQGRLTDQEGNPASSVTVLLEVTDMRIRRQIGYENAKSQVDGTFLFDLEKYSELPEIGMQFNTLSPRYRESMKIVVAKVSEFPVTVELSLKPGSVAKGKVVGDDGGPVADAEVGLSGGRTVRTTASGEFEVFGLPPEGKSTVVANKEGFSEGFVEVQSTTPSIVDGLVIRISAASTLKGQAIDPTGKPLSPGEVTLYVGERYRSARLDKEGRFSLEAVPLDLSGLGLVLSTPEFLPLEHKFTDAERASREVTLQTNWPLRLAGRVLDSEGNPCPGVEVIIGDGMKERPYTFNTDDKGEWLAFPFPVGEPVVVTAIPPSPDARRESGELEFLKELYPGTWKAEVNPWPGGYKSTFEVKVDGLNVTMKRVDSGVGGFPGVTVYTGTVDAAYKQIKGKLVVESTGASGEFTAKAYEPRDDFEGVWDLRATITAGKHLLAPAQARFIGAPFPGTQWFDLTLSPPLQISGIAKGEDGSPIQEGGVAVVSWDRTRVLQRRAEIKAGGSFLLDGLPKGVIQVQLTDGRGRALTPPQPLRGGIKNVELSLGTSAPDPMDPIDAPVGKK